MPNEKTTRPPSETADLLFDADQSPRRDQVQHRFRPFVPPEYVGGSTGHDRAVCEDAPTGRLIGVHGTPGDLLEHAAEHQAWIGRMAYQYARPSRPRGSNVAVCRIVDAVPSSSGVTSNSSQPRPGSFRSAESRSRRSGS